MVKINCYGNLKKLRTIDCLDIANIIGQNVRVCINANDPLLKVCEELGYDTKPENGQTEKNCQTKVISFPLFLHLSQNTKKKKQKLM